jgi:hypothetical protein
MQQYASQFWFFLTVFTLFLNHHTCFLSLVVAAAEWRRRELSLLNIFNTGGAHAYLSSGEEEEEEEEIWAIAMWPTALTYFFFFFAGRRLAFTTRHSQFRVKTHNFPPASRITMRRRRRENSATRN